MAFRRSRRYFIAHLLWETIVNLTIDLHPAICLPLISTASSHLVYSFHSRKSKIKGGTDARSINGPRSSVIFGGGCNCNVSRFAVRRLTSESARKFAVAILHSCETHRDEACALYSACIWYLVTYLFQVTHTVIFAEWLYNTWLSLAI